MLKWVTARVKVGKKHYDQKIMFLMILHGHNEERKRYLAFFFSKFFRHARPLIILPPRIFGRVSSPLNEWVCHSLQFVQRYPVENYDDMKRRAFFLFFIPRPTFSKHTHGGWIRGPTNQSFTFHANRRSRSCPVPTDKPHKHLNTPLNFNLAILISAPGAPNFTSSL